MDVRHQVNGFTAMLVKQAAAALNKVSSHRLVLSSKTKIERIRAGHALSAGSV
jgi:hypothetical protein